jgi:Asp-tRNA(Asn)/Glu-tRNA(Gln) amidotransferase C subunit
MGQAADIDLETLDRMARELLGREFSREWLEKFKLQLDGILEETSRLDELDVADVEPARVFRNG